MSQVGYTRFMKPLTGKLLGFLKLDKVYTDGRGNWLVYQDQEGRTRRVLDATGGYGANLLGHKHPDILGAVPMLLADLPPNHVQGSVSKWSVMLAEKLSDLLSAEVHEGPWICTFANSGAEAVEAALKHALLHHKESTQKQALLLNTSFNTFRLQMDDLASEQKPILLEQFRSSCRIPEFPKTLSKAMDQTRDLREAVDCLEEYNKGVLSASPYFLAVEGGFHGKTLGALSVTNNPAFRDDFFLDDANIRTLFIRRNDPGEIGRILETVRTMVFLPEIRNGSGSLKTREVNKIAAAILEPIQGEGGIHPLEKTFVTGLREAADQRGFLLIFDEVQAGLYRTGTLASGTRLGVCADEYCFSKAMGGGVAKIAAMLVRKEKYVPRFGFLHSSTFAEDSFSSAVACKVLALLCPTSVEKGMGAAEELKLGLEHLRKRYPVIIREVRGRGFLLGIEFHPEIRQSCYEFKFFCDLGMLGYLFSSALLHHHDLRLNPTLSSPLTLRLEPSLFTTKEEVRLICEGLDGLCRAISLLDMTYFFGHIFPGVKIGSPHRIQKGVIRYEKGTKPSAVFLSHVIRTEDFKEVFHSLANVDEEILENHLKDLFELVEFSVYFHGPLKGNHGREVDAVILALPVPSGVIRDLYKSDRSHVLSRKIQNAIRYARELGAATVGLGQFTSIVTKNGLSLDRQGLNLTTGNAYTVALMIEAALKLAREKNIDMKEAHIGFVGAAGNIISVCSSVLAEYCERITFFYHTPLQGSRKLGRVLLRFLQDMAGSNSDANCARTISNLLGNGIPKGREDLLSFLKRPEVKSVLSTETDLALLRRCDLILTGTNSTRSLIEPSFVKENAVIVDAGIPGDISADLRRTRPDVTIIKGGIAQLPEPDAKPQTIVLPSLPLKSGQAFGCMSETFGIGLYNGRGIDIYHAGPLSREIVQKAKTIAESVGFRLCEYKNLNTFDF